MTEKEQDDFMMKIAAFQSGDLTAEELAKFESDLVNDIERRRLFIEAQRRSTAIAEVFCRDAIPGSQLELASKEQSSDPKSSGRSFFGALLFVAASILLAVVLVPTRKDKKRETVVQAPKISFARITYADSVVWRQEDSVTPAVGDKLGQGVPYHLVSGTVRLRMEGGGIVTMAAPSLFKGINADEIELMSGKIAARLPDEDSDLSVHVGDVSVRDLGTAFGITAKPDGAVDLSVFDGSVAVQTSGVDGDIDERQFNEGESVVSIGDSDIDAKVPFNAVQYEDIWPLTIGIDDVSSIIELAEPGPQQSLRELANSSKLLMIPEQLNKRVGQDIDLQFLQPGTSWPQSKPEKVTLRPNQVVSSYLLAYVPKDHESAPQHSISGSIRFQKKILGVVMQGPALKKSDRLFGVPEIKYDSLAWRRLEGTVTDQGKVPADSLKISEDGRDLYFNLYVSSGQDCFRVLVDEGSSP